MLVKVIVWKDEYGKSDESIVEKCTDVKKISIDKRFKIRELMDKISSEFEIPVNKLKIIKKAFMGNNSFAENISSRAYYEHSMNQARVYEGSILLVEEMENVMLKSKWQFELDRELNRLNIKFNNPDDKPNYMGHVEFKYSVIIDS
mmetsp:Transcript_26682/g.4742  ORF Transcript_26682/g.4742 Transcript_26682/m.4742 type:complete len:146 (+) Transcript_26682:1733-2170(+)